MTTRAIRITDDIAFGGDNPPLFIAGPCVIESREHVLAMARTIRALRDELKINLVFKASFDKANRTSIESFRGPGLEKGLALLKEVKDETGLPVLSDIHEWQQAAPAAEVLDVIQIPAFLCRQTDLIAAAARTGKPIAVKKGQFLSPEETKNILDKAAEVGNERVFIPEGGTPQFARPLARAAAAAGADGFFMEVHDNPPAALSDRTTQLRPEAARAIIEDVLAIRAAVPPL